MALRAFRLDALPEEPWRNGGGRTRTIATRMRDADAAGSAAQDEGPPWDWRISVATIERGGPFSSFPGVDRSSMLLDAGRIELSAAGEPTLLMQSPGDVVRYRGDSVTTSAVHGASQPLSVLNVMTRRSAAQAWMKALRDDSYLAAQGLALLVLEGSWRVVDGSMGAEDPDHGLTLHSGEGAWCTVSAPGSRAIWRVERLSATGMLAAIELDRS